MYKIDFKEYFIYLNDVHKYGKKNNLKNDSSWRYYSI